MFFNVIIQNEDRQYADLAAVRVLDAKGHDWVRGTAARIRVDIHDPEVQRLFGDAPLGWLPQAVRVEPTTAHPIAALKLDQPAAAILANRFERGQAYLIATSDGCCERDDPFWRGLARLAAGEPTLVVKAEDAGRYRFIPTRAAGVHVLHVIDSQTDLPGSPPHPLTVSVNPERIGSPRQAVQIGRDQPLEMSSKDGCLTLVVHPDPVASIVLE